MLRLVLVVIALTLVGPTDAMAKDAVVVRLRDGGAAKAAPSKTRATKRKVVRKRQAKAAAKKKSKPKRKRVELRPMP